MRIWAKLAGVVCLAVLAGGLSAEDPKGRPAGGKKSAEKGPLTDSKFVEMAASSGMTEVAAGKVAQTRASSADVKDFAAQMVKDHTKNNMELLSIVSDLRIAVPEKPLPEHEKHLRDLQGEGVRNFDQMYMKMMVMSHEEAVDLMTRGSKELKNERLRAYAEKTLPAVKEHLEMARKINDKVGGGIKGRGKDRE